MLHGVSRYINNLPIIINKNAAMILYVDDTSILITYPNKVNFNVNINQTFRHINSWFKDNFLTLNYTKTQYLKFKLSIIAM